MVPFPSYKLRNYSRALSRYMELYFYFKLTMIKGMQAQSTRILWFVHFYIKLFVAEITFYLDKYDRCTLPTVMLDCSSYKLNNNCAIHEES